jgi:hypothetical protein
MSRHPIQSLLDLRDESLNFREITLNVFDIGPDQGLSNLMSGK